MALRLFGILWQIRTQRVHVLITVYTLAAKYPKGATLRPKSILCGYRDPLGGSRGGFWSLLFFLLQDLVIRV